MLWEWDGELYFCLLPVNYPFEEIKERMETSSSRIGPFTGITLTEDEPHIGEYITCKRLLHILDTPQDTICEIPVEIFDSGFD